MLDMKFSHNQNQYFGCGFLCQIVSPFCFISCFTTALKVSLRAKKGKLQLHDDSDNRPGPAAGALWQQAYIV